MKWLKENGCSFTVYASLEASEIGNLKIMKWLKENGCSFTGSKVTIKKEMSHWSGAVKFGNIDNMAWLKEIGCPFMKETFSEAT